MSAPSLIFTIRYYPSSLRSEFVTIGIALFDLSAERCSWSWLKGWRRANAYAGHDVELATERYREDMESRRWSLPALVAETQQRAGVVLLHGPRPSLLSPAKALEAARATELVDVFDRHSARGTDRRMITRRAFKAVRAALGARRQDLVHFVEEHYVIEGRSRTRQFDLAIKNSKPLHILQSFSFDVVNQETVLGELERVAFAVSDVRQAIARADTPFSFAVLPPSERSEWFEAAIKVANDNDISIVDASSIGDWAERRADEALYYAETHGA